MLSASACLPTHTSAAVWLEWAHSCEVRVITGPAEGPAGEEKSWRLFWEEEAGEVAVTSPGSLWGRTCLPASGGSPVPWARPELGPSHLCPRKPPSCRQHWWGHGRPQLDPGPWRGTGRNSRERQKGLAKHSTFTKATACTGRPWRRSRADGVWVENFYKHEQGRRRGPLLPTLDTGGVTAMAAPPGPSSPDSDFFSVLPKTGNPGGGSGGQAVSDGHVGEVPAKTEKGRVELEGSVPYSNLPPPRSFPTVCVSLLPSCGVRCLRRPDSPSELWVALNVPGCHSPWS